MAIRQLVADEAPELSAVQSRLTVAGITMSALFFAGTFAIGLYNPFDMDVVATLRKGRTGRGGDDVRRGSRLRVLGQRHGVRHSRGS